MGVGIKRGESGYEKQTLHVYCVLLNPVFWLCMNYQLTQQAIGHNILNKNVFGLFVVQSAIHCDGADVKPGRFRFRLTITEAY